MITGSGMICIKLRLVGLGGGDIHWGSHTTTVFLYFMAFFINSIVIWYFCDMHSIFAVMMMIMMIMMVIMIMTMMIMMIIMMTMMMKLWMGLEA